MDTLSTSLLSLGTVIAGLGSNVVFSHLYGGILLLLLAAGCFFLREYFKID